MNKPDLDDYATKAGDNTFTGDNTFSGHNTVFSDTVIVPQAVNQTTLGYTKNEMQAVSYKDLMFIFDSLNRRHDAELENLLDSLTNRIAELEDRLPFECGTSKVEDADGNRYATVVIGTQCWMKENLRTTKYANGTAIEVGTSTSTTIPYRYAPNGNESNVATYGYLYNWVAVMNGASSSDANPSGVQGICPTGWHVPSDEEWTQLETYVKSQTDYQCSGSYIAKALASTAGWNTSGTTCAVGNIPDDNNKTGFSVLPAGNYSGSYYNIGGNASLWSATEGGSTYAYGCGLNYANAYVARGTSYKENAFSVRCLRD